MDYNTMQCIQWRAGALSAHLPDCTLMLPHGPTTLMLPHRTVPQWPIVAFFFDATRVASLELKCTISMPGPTNVAFSGSVKNGKVDLLICLIGKYDRVMVMDHTKATTSLFAENR